MKAIRFPMYHLAAGFAQRSWNLPFHSLRTMLQTFGPLVIPFIFLLPRLNSFLYPTPGATFSDLSISHYPNAIYLIRELLAGNGVPLWSNTILSGYPFAADPLSGLWYPPGWLALIFPLPLGFNLLVAMHLLFGGVGMVLLLRAEGLSRPAALLGGLAFEVMPKLFAHLGAGHLTLLYAVPWTPWLLLAARGALHSTDHMPRVKFRWWPPIILALICLADIRWAAYAGAIWLAYVYFNHQRSARELRGLATGLSFQIFLAALLSAPAWLPLLEFTRLSTRAHLAAADVLAYSLPPARLLGLLFPDFGGFHEWMLYPGLVVFTLGLLAVLWSTVRRRAHFWVWMVVLSLVFSLGSILPFMAWLSRLPGLDLLRVPSRALFLTGLSLAVLGAYGLDHILTGPSAVEKRRAGLLLAAIAGFSLLFSGGIWTITGGIPLNFAWGVGLALAAAIWISLGLRRQVSSGLWLVILLGLSLVDLDVIDNTLLVSRSSAMVLSQGEAAARYLAAQPGLFRVYSPSYSLPQQTAIRYGLQLADGVDPLQLKAYALYMEKASGVPVTGYSVTLPPFASGLPARDNAASLPDPARLGLLNVRYVVSEFDLPVQGLELEATFGQTRVYSNQMALPRAWIQAADVMPGEQIRPAEFDHWSANQISLTAKGPGLLVLSEINYPGWKAWVDGKPAKMQVVAGLLRGVFLEPGLHRVVFGFQPMSVYIALVLAGMGVLLLGVWNRLHKRQPLVDPISESRNSGLDSGDRH
jgi:hypothetical protein